MPSDTQPDAPRDPQAIEHSRWVPFDPGVHLYIGNTFAHAVPYEHTGWREETMAWKESCYLNGNLNPSPTYRLKGPGALELLQRVCVNSFESFPVGSGKHGIMCNEAGLVMMDGVIVRLDEDEFITYWMSPYIAYALQRGSYAAVGEELTGKVFLFQLAGPRSLEILEKATGQDHHDIRFMRHRQSGINGMRFNVLRMGMAGTLAYELHGNVEDAIPVYRALMEAGAEFGLRRLGQRAYMLNHTEDGFPQAYYHFPYPWLEDHGFVDYLEATGQFQWWSFVWSNLRGSMGQDLSLRYRNPVELGWGKMIKLDHDFVGRAALGKELAAPRRAMVTLVWNEADILDVHASQYRPGEPYLPLDSPNDAPGTGLWADQVLRNGKRVGISSGRAYSYNYRRMLSLCSIDVEHAALGNEVDIVWGEPGKRQKHIRATVGRFPYLNENRNQDVDVSAIPPLKTRPQV
jgi:glycine cleavage system aminomethyltransferase T